MSEKVIQLEARSVRFFSPHDEAAFFEWLGKVRCVKKIEGRDASLFVSVDLPAVDELALRELLSLFRRYNVDMRQLARLDRDEFAEWFHESNAYWYKGVFGQGPVF